MYNKKNIYDQLVSVFRKSVARITVLNSLNDILPENIDFKFIFCEKSSEYDCYTNFINNLTFDHELTKLKYLRKVKHNLNHYRNIFAKVYTNTETGQIFFIFRKRFVNHYVLECSREKDKYGSSPNTKQFYVLSFCLNPLDFFNQNNAKILVFINSLSKIYNFAGITINKELFISDDYKIMYDLTKRVLLKYLDNLGRKLNKNAEENNLVVIHLAQELLRQKETLFIDTKFIDGNIQNSEVKNELMEFVEKEMKNIINKTFENLGIKFDLISQRKNLKQFNFFEVFKTNFSKNLFVDEEQGTFFIDKQETKHLIENNAHEELDLFYNIANIYLKIRRGTNKIILFFDNHETSKELENSIEVIDTEKVVEVLSVGLMETKKPEDTNLSSLIKTYGKNFLHWSITSTPLENETKIKPNEKIFLILQRTYSKTLFLLLKFKNHIQKQNFTKLKFLTTRSEHLICIQIANFKNIISKIVKTKRINYLNKYLLNFCVLVNEYFEEEKFSDYFDNPKKIFQKYLLVKSILQIFKNSFVLLGIKI